MNISDIATLPEEKIMEALLSIDFDIDETEEVFIPKKSFKKKDKSLNRKFEAAQKYKIKDKRILFKNVSRYDYNSQSDIIKRGDIFSVEALMEVKYKALVTVPEIFIAKPFLATFKRKPAYFGTSTENYFYDPYSSSAERIVYESWYGTEKVLKDFYSKKPIYRPFDVEKIKDMPHLDFEETVSMRKEVEKTKTHIPGNGKEFFYGKPIQRRIYCAGVYLYGAEGRGADWYEWTGREFKAKQNKYLSQKEIKEEIENMEDFIVYGGDYYSLYPAPWEQSFSEYGDEFVTEIKVEAAEDILFDFNGLPNFFKDTFQEECCHCQNED